MTETDEACLPDAFPWLMPLHFNMTTLISHTQIKIQTESENPSCLASPVELLLLLDWSTAASSAAGQGRPPAGHIQGSHPPETTTTNTTFPLEAYDIECQISVFSD